MVLSAVLSVVLSAGPSAGPSAAASLSGTSRDPGTVAEGEAERPSAVGRLAEEAACPEEARAAAAQEGVPGAALAAEGRPSVALRAVAAAAEAPTSVVVEHCPGKGEKEPGADFFRKPFFAVSLKSTVSVSVLS